jgi:hypothetical protein
VALLEKTISLSQKDLRGNSASVHGTAFVRGIPIDNLCFGMYA